MARILSVENNLNKITGSKNIRSGENLQIKILQNKDGICKISAKTNIFTVKQPLPYSVGTTLFAKATWIEGILQFKILYTNSNTQAGLFYEHFKKDDFFRIFVSEAKMAGFSLKEEALNIIKKIFKNKKTISKKEVRTAIESIKKGAFS